jgi:hypothetical protein
MLSFAEGQGARKATSDGRLSDGSKSRCIEPFRENLVGGGDVDVYRFRCRCRRRYKQRRNKRKRLIWFGLRARKNDCFPHLTLSSPTATLAGAYPSLLSIDSMTINAHIDFRSRHLHIRLPCDVVD